MKSLLVTATGLALITFIYWYSGSSQPLNSKEIDAYLNTLAAQPHNPGRHDLQQLERFMREDDGRAFYTVNLYQFNQFAKYPSFHPGEGTGLQAFTKFRQVMLQLLATHASHPIFGTHWIEDTTPWQSLVIVRYRSRRDIIDIFASDTFATASIHKWAALKQNQRFIVQSLHIPELILPTGLLILLLALAWIKPRKLFGQVG